MDAAAKVRLKTGAKLNLFLRVVGRRSDGFHELESIFHSVDFADDLEVAPAPGPAIAVSAQAEDGVVDLPPVEDNLVYIAARRLQQHAGVERGAEIALTKRIPIGGGLGGGSSNAAGALVALDELWELDLDRESLLRLAAEIGSDVPYCVAGGSASLVTGRGEKLSPLAVAPTPLWFVLGISDVPLSTAQVYAELARSPGDDPASTAAVAMAVGDGDLDELAGLLFNALEAPALRLRPDLSARKRALLEAGAMGAGLSGSGPTLFGLAHDEGHAHEVAAGVSAAFDRVVVARSTTGCVLRA